MNQSRGQRDVFVALPGIMEQYLPDKLRGRPKDFFTYGTSFLPILAGASLTTTVQINTDADFLLVMVVGLARNAATEALVANPTLTAQLSSGSSGRLYSNQALEWDTLYGTAQLPFVCPYPKVITAGDQLSTQLNHTVAGGTNLNVRIAYHGVKIFP